MRFIIVEKTHMDLSSLDGDVIHLFDREIERRPSPFEPAEFRVALRRRLTAIDYKPNKDAVVIVGPVISIAYLFAVLAAYEQKLNIMIWSLQDNIYVHRTWDCQQYASNASNSSSPQS